MTVIVINEDNHGDIGIALNYYHAIKWLIGEQWIDDSTEIWSNPDEDGIYPSWTTIKEMFGEDWTDMMLDEWDMNKFNDFWRSSFYLREVEIIGTEDD